MKRYIVGHLGWRYGYLCGKVFSTDELTNDIITDAKSDSTFQVFDTEEGKILSNPEALEWKDIKEVEPQKILNSQ